MAWTIARTGLDCVRGNEPLVEVGKLGCICFSVMTSGLYGCTPVAANVAFTDSGVKARRYARPNTPAKSPFPTPHICESSKACISVQNSVFIFAKQTTSSP